MSIGRVVVVLSVSPMLAGCPFDVITVDEFDAGLQPDDGESGEPPAPPDPAQPLPPVWSEDSETAWAEHLALIDGALVGSSSPSLVLAGTPYDLPPRLAMIPLGEGGPAPWSFVGSAKQSFDGLATDAGGEVVVMARDWSAMPAHLWLARFSPAGQPLWSRHYVALAGDEAMVLAPDGGIVVVEKSPARVHRFDPDGAYLWSHAAAAGTEFTDATTDAQGRIFVVGVHEPDPDVDEHRLSLTGLDAGGEAAWSFEHAAPLPHISSPAIGRTSAGTLVVAMGQDGAGLEYDVGMLGGFDAAGVPLWWRMDQETSWSQVQALQVLALPAGDVLVRWWVAGEDFGRRLAIRYDAGGNYSYELQRWGDFINDAELGSDGQIYTLQGDEWDPEVRVIPYPL